MNIEKIIKEELQKVLNENYEAPKKDDMDDRGILYDDEFITELAFALKGYGSESLDTDKIAKVVKNQSLSGMYQADDRDMYYDYKSRFNNAHDIATKTMHLIQRAEHWDKKDPKFTDYDNVSKTYRIHEKAKSKSQQRLMGMAYAYKQAKKEGDMYAINDLFDTAPENVEQKVKGIANSMSMSDLEDYAETEHGDLPNKVDENSELFSEPMGKLEMRDQEGSTDLLKRGDHKGKFNAFKKAVRKDRPIRYKGMTIDPMIAKSALKIANKVDKSAEVFFSRPLTQIIGVATKQLEEE